MNRPKYVFGGFENLTAWSNGFAFILSFLPPLARPKYNSTSPANEIFFFFSAWLCIVIAKIPFTGLEALGAGAVVVELRPSCEYFFTIAVDRLCIGPQNSSRSPPSFEPHHYQMDGICKVLDGIDLAAVAQTGSGKTAYLHFPPP
ncbi:hypothetical protein B0H13DRAFT_1865132 [Mycena leptocephala]|nr:hypothetical protein B0H13DRAFT_1865132 [Mycena leptocephala]